MRPDSPRILGIFTKISFFNGGRFKNTYNNTIMLSIHIFVAIYTFAKMQKQKVEKNVPCASCRPKTSQMPEFTPHDYIQYTRGHSISKETNFSKCQ